MLFFIPTELVELNYLGGESEPTDEKASAFSNYADLAFFVVNLGFSKAEYNELTPTERLFILKAYENKQMFDISMMYKAFYTATYNVNRGKKRALRLFESVQKVADMETVKENKKIIDEVDKIEGEDWLKKIGVRPNERR